MYADRPSRSCSILCRRGHLPSGVSSFPSEHPIRTMVTGCLARYLGDDKKNILKLLLLVLYRRLEGLQEEAWLCSRLQPALPCVDYTSSHLFKQVGVEGLVLCSWSPGYISILIDSTRGRLFASRETFVNITFSPEGLSIHADERERER